MSRDREKLQSRSYTAVAQFGPNTRGRDRISPLMLWKDTQCPVFMQKNVQCSDRQLYLKKYVRLPKNVCPKSLELGPILAWICLKDLGVLTKKRLFFFADGIFLIKSSDTRSYAEAEM